MGNWVKYARFEEEQKELERARSVFERALEVDHRSAELWLRYAEFEMRNELVNHARNVLDRSVGILPRVDFLWYKYVYMEEMVGDAEKTRAVFERWMKWVPDDNAFLSYARFECRCGNVEGAREVMKRYVNTYPSSKSFLKFAKWCEFEGKDTGMARSVFESALSELEPEEVNARVFQMFAGFEERHGEYDRARVIYKHAVQLFHLDEKDPSKRRRTDIEEDDSDLTEQELKKRATLYKAYVTFEKKHGDQKGIENVLLMKQRAEYQAKLEEDATDYDSWFEYARLEEDHAEMGDVKATAKVRDVYERAVANLPPKQEKQYWKRYIYLWINYATYEELTNQDLTRASQIYQTCLSLIPHKSFSFAKVWIYAAKLHIRNHDLLSARKLLGRAIAQCGKTSIFDEYIAIELALGEIDRCRLLYEQYLKHMPHNCEAWGKYAQLEKGVGESERCRALYNLAIRQPSLDMPEMLWKGYIDFEIEEGEAQNARSLYEKLLERTAHVKVWISFAQFEGTSIGEGVQKARSTFQRAHDQFKNDNNKEERVLLLDAWRVFEKAKGDAASITEVENKMPRRVKRKRIRVDENTGQELGWEEYFDYHFPDDEGAAAGNLKILEMAAKWKKKQDENKDENDDEDDGSDSDSDED